MRGLLYKEDFDEARDRLTRWWNGEDIGRPAMQITVPRAPIADIPAIPEPDGCCPHYTTADFGFRVNLALRSCNATAYLAEAIPAVSPDLGANCLALYLGCTAVEEPTTVWFEPCIDSPEQARFEIEPTNFYWDCTRRLTEEQLRLGAGKFVVAFPDLIEGLDTLAAMRDTQPLLTDLLDRPEWVRDCLHQITERYFEAYDHLYDRIKDDRRGSHFWAWAPGRMAKLQCDFAAMISPEMFAEFMVPVLTAMTERLDYSMFHWDGPGALVHCDHLLAIPRLSMLQWTPGASAEPVMDRRWWPYYHRAIEAGKKVILLGFAGVENLRAFKREFGSRLKQFMLSMSAPTLQHADELLLAVAD
ncbi:MAG: hypothetical protein CL878_07215 [Dehalococcoidia bacterium]|nr:hypothetical protein [Dehalococcoidia bacterium]